LEFVQAAEGLGVKVFYVTNRSDVVKEATIKNLNQLGFKADDSNVLTKNDELGRGDDKVSRRAMVAENYRIVLLIGDSMSDLCSGMDASSTQQRNEVATKKIAMLGTRWIMMPNPVYGGWERLIPKDETAFDTLPDDSQSGK
jgi:acid phosphatase